MPLKNFLNAVLPNEGYKCWVEISKSKKVTQGLVPTIEELAVKLSEIDGRGSDAYFGCASYATDRNRRGANALGAKAFWADIDAGEGKPYVTADDAIQACDEFCGRVGLPLPGIVRSGSGIHLYWPLDRTVAAQEWLYIAQRLKLLMHAQGFHADPSRTADIASILRPTGTKNYKLCSEEGAARRQSPTARSVEVDDWDFFVPLSCEEFKEIAIKNIDVAPAQKINSPSNLAPNLNLASGINVPKIDPTQGVSEGGRNNACASYAGTLLAKGYSPDDVLKACLKWNELNQPPLSDQEVHTTVASMCRRHQSNNVLPAAPAPATAQMPDLPNNFLWGPQHQLIAKVKDQAADGSDIFVSKIISQLPIFLSAWMNEEGHKQRNSYMFTHYHPVRGWQQFIMGAKEFNGSDWYGSLAENGCSLMLGADKLFKTYVREAENMLRLPGKEMTRYSQLGWKQDDKAFLVGENLCHADGTVEKAFGTDKLSPIMKSMMPSRGGSLEQWTTAANKLGTPGMEAHLFMVLASIAAPLMKFCVDEGNGGSILSIISEDSGHGKTPMATAAASVWGDLGGTVVTGNFTENRRIEELVRHCHLPQIQEEAAYSDPTIAALGVEKFTSGTDRGRLNQAGAASGVPERYQTILLSLSNKSLYELVRMVNIPMSRRIFEIEIPRPSEQDLANLGGIAREMMRNSGHAGLAFARLIVAPEIKKYIAEHLQGSNTGKVGSVQLKYRELLESRPEHRFIIWMVSAVEVAAQICRHYGLLHFDVERIMQWVSNRARDRIEGSGVDDSALKLNSFLSEHADCCVTVPRPYSPKNGPLMPLRLPARKLQMRLEMINERLYIDHQALQKWCTKNSISFVALGKKLTETGIVLERSKMISLAAGTQIPGGRALCWEIDMGHPAIKGELRIELREQPPEARINQV